MEINQILVEPQSVFVMGASGTLSKASHHPDGWSTGGTRVRWNETPGGGEVWVSSPAAAVSRIILRWPHWFSPEMLFLGDEWERGYGDLQWRHLEPSRVMPWYFLAHEAAKGVTQAFGVKTQPNAMCFWLADGKGISLCLDVRNGGGPVSLGQRELHAATVLMHRHENATAFAAARAFCRAMCPDGITPAKPICGNNNWYYAYGKNFDANAVLGDAEFLARISQGCENRPYCVIDAGWKPYGDAPGRPWDKGDTTRFPDMPGLAAAIKASGVLPGIWMRLSADSAGQPQSGPVRAGPQLAPEVALDLSHPANIEMTAEDVERIRSWGYRLLKHDFSTFDTFARWGFQMGAEITNNGWHFFDQSRTTAEILLDFYRTIRRSAGDMVIIGCNTVGHLAAGLVELQRVGDDTSGKQWERTRRMGINTLAFRLPQHGSFFATDADCVAHTSRTPWEKDRQFLDLVARSGTPLFVSVDPRTLPAEKEAAFASAMQLALNGGYGEEVEPLDWLHNNSPSSWRFGSEFVEYDWIEESGPWPLGC